MTELEKAEHDVEFAKRAANVADWKALEAKATYTHCVAESYEAQAELQAARIRLADAEKRSFEKAQYDLAISALTQKDEGLLADQQDVSPQESAPDAPEEEDDDAVDFAPMSDFSRGAQDAIDGEPEQAHQPPEYYNGYEATTQSLEAPTQPADSDGPGDDALFEDEAATEEDWEPSEQIWTVGGGSYTTDRPPQRDASPAIEEPEEIISDLIGDPAIEPESGLHGEAAVDDAERAADIHKAEALKQDLGPPYSEEGPAKVFSAGINREIDAKAERKPFKILGVEIGGSKAKTDEELV
jgi:hypothetical protein